LAALTVGLGLSTYIIYTDAHRAAASASHDRIVHFEKDVERSHASIEVQINRYRVALRGMQGLFAASRSIERDEWQAFTRTAIDPERFPSIKTVAVITRVRTGKMDEFLTYTHGDAMPDFAIRPASPNDISALATDEADGAEHWVLTHAEPEASAALIGWDLRTVPAALPAMEAARDANEPMHILCRSHEGSTDLIAFLPIFTNEMPHTTVEERRLALWGWVSMRVDTRGLIEESELHNLHTGNYAVEITTAGLTDNTTRTTVYKFGSPAVGTPNGSTATMERSYTVPILGSLWNFKTTVSAPRERMLAFVSWKLAGVGIVISVLAAAFVHVLAQSRKRAQAANHLKSVFLANMSHEIRTPLTAILGYAELLREEGDVRLDPGQRRETIDTMKSAGEHLLTLINDILDLSKIEADRMTVERTETPLTGIIQEVVSMMQARVAGKGVVLAAELASPVPDRIMSDPTRLRQILVNLTGNAVKFTRAGHVTIRARVEPDEERSRLVIDVEDTGLGMSTEEAGEIFQPFVQADASVTRKHGGTGLGLTICRRLAGLMEGSVSLVRTSPGEGSTFRLEVPLNPAPGAILVSSFDAVVPSPGIEFTPLALSGRILLAEDGADNQRLIAFHLRKAGATVEIADNGRIALEMINENEAAGTPYDMLLTDMQMPEMDGYLLAHTLRQRGSILPIVALTAHAMTGERARCIAAGCDDYATKPIDRAKLLDVCRAWIGKGGQRHERRAA
jgi:signal transduction histidine kinase/ActR/RegA family two-component response regulator